MEAHDDHEECVEFYHETDGWMEDYEPIRDFDLALPRSRVVFSQAPHGGEFVVAAWRDTHN